MATWQHTRDVERWVRLVWSWRSPTDKEVQCIKVTIIFWVCNDIVRNPAPPWMVENPIGNGMVYHLSTGAGILPFTVSMELYACWFYQIGIQILMPLIGSMVGCVMVVSTQSAAPSRTIIISWIPCMGFLNTCLNTCFVGQLIMLVCLSSSFSVIGFNAFFYATSVVAWMTLSGNVGAAVYSKNIQTRFERGPEMVLCGSYKIL